MSGRVELVAGTGDAGKRLDVLAAAAPRVGSRAAAQRLIEAGKVTVDGSTRPKRHLVSSGERVIIELDWAEPPEGAADRAAPHTIVFEDAHLIVVDKPPGVVVHPAPGYPTGTLVQALAERAAGGPEPWRPGIVHRLDRDTSGLLVVAKSQPVHRALQRAIQSREMRREYIALIDGRPPSRKGTIDAPIGRDRDRRTVVSTRSDRSRTARTHFRRLEALAGSTLVEARLETGRTHQVRAHFAAIGHPVLGDAAYGGGAEGRLGLARQFLHSARLAFSHPVEEGTVELASELPEDLRAALERARGESGGP